MGVRLLRCNHVGACERLGVTAGSTIIQQIDIFQQAFTYAETVMKSMLDEAVTKVFEDVWEEVGWDGVSNGLKHPWVASRAWRTTNDDDEDYKHLIWFVMEGVGSRQDLWVSKFAGAGGAEIVISINFELNATPYKAMMLSRQDLIDGLIALGCSINSKLDVHLPIAIDREVLARGFSDGDLAEAMEPLSIGLQKLVGATDLMEELHRAVRDVYERDA